LALSKRELGVLRKEVPEALWGRLDLARGQIDEAIQQTRSLTFELSPSTLYTFGLEAAIEELAERLSRQEGFQCHLQVPEGDEPLPEQTKVLLYRATCELLINVGKHAAAKNVFIRIQRVDRSIQVEVEDDGKGFDPSELESLQRERLSFGLYSLRERLTYIGGSFEIRSAPGHGTKVTIQVPLRVTERKDSRSQP
jgi:signal transduction histidine kinase